MYEKINKKDTYTILMAFLICLGSCIFMNISLTVGFLGSILFSLFLLTKRGFSLCYLLKIIVDGLKECKKLYLFILLIGGTISVWLSSGVVPSIMYYGFEYMKGINFLFAAYVITSFMSIFMGTAVGTISTIGIAVLGIGQGFHIPKYILLGVIVSSSFIADKLSPISGLFNLTLSVTHTKYKQVIKAMMKTFIPTYIITGMIYYYIGANLQRGASNIELYQSVISNHFIISPYLLLFPILFLIFSLFEIEIIWTVLIGIFGGSMISVFVQKITFHEVLRGIFLGYHLHSSSHEFNQIFHSGGIISMMEVVLIVMGAIALGNLLERTGILSPMIEKILSRIYTKKQLVFYTGLMSSIFTIVTCDQTVGIVIPSKVFKDKYEKLEVDDTILARTISDTGTIIAPLIPWNVNALIIGAIISISPLQYGPYAVLCYLAPIITILASFKSSKGKFYYKSKGGFL